MFEYFFGGRSSRRYEVKGLGSGFIISQDGYILTNHHVAGNASKIIITLTNGEKYNADIIGSDMVSDVCLLKINTNKKLPYLKFANSDDVIVGEWAIAFGNPFGLFDMNTKPSITVGVISNKNVSFFQSDNRDYRVYKDMLQTDAAISSGNSGGPLLNSLGEVIGMNTVIFSTATNQKGAGSIGIGFAVPINRVRNIIDIIKSGKKIERNIYTGMEVDAITPEIARYYQLSKDNGIYVNRIYRNTAADESGIEPGDIITAINGEPINNSDSFYMAVGDAMVGDKLKVEVLRGEKKSTHTLVIRKER
ncbi:MAG: trypsin-like peptidase domain-containing protein [Bacteroidetes bacterium]|nr:trypsin-like peptidase domain-containing protein [Bacteroidota bacterium]